jgi:signal transduction histidine kinase
MPALQPATRARALRVAAWIVAGVTVTMAGVSVLLFLLNTGSLPATPGQPWLVTAVAQVGAPAWATAALGVVGALIVQRTPRHRFAWALLFTTATVALVLLAEEYAEIGLVLYPGSLPGAAVAAWVQTLGYALMPLGIFIVMLLFPTGALFSRLLIPIIVAGAVMTAVFMLTQFDLTQPLGLTIRPGVLLPVTMPPGLWPVGAIFAPVYWPALWAWAALPLVGAVLVWVRLMRAKAVERDQLRWIALTGIVAAVGWAGIFAPQVLGDTAVPEAIGQWASVLWIIGICIGVPVTVAIAILRYNVYDIDRVLARTLLYGGLTLSVAVLYVIVVFGLGSLIGGEAKPVLSLAVIVIVAVGLTPLRDRLQALANRVVYGPRATPLEALSHVAQSMTLTPAIDDQLPQIAALVGNATSSAGVDIWLRDEDYLRLATRWPDGLEEGGGQRIPLTGDDLRAHFRGRSRVLPVRAEDELLGCIVVTQPPARSLTPNEENLLSAVASHAGLLLRNVRLVEDLRASRQRVLTAGADRQRALERNLHDGAQQHLVTASLALGLARAQLARGDLSEVDHSLLEATQQLKDGLGELRDLARGLYPAILSRAGLEAALATLAERAPLPVDLNVELSGRRAPIVESTVYYVVSEALVNVAKHADAGRAAVRAHEEDSRLEIEIEDDGRGGAIASPGSGLRGLQDRVETMGGSLTLESPAGEGTRIHVELPAGQLVPETAALASGAP